MVGSLVSSRIEGSSRGSASGSDHRVQFRQRKPDLPTRGLYVAYRTALGYMTECKIEDALETPAFDQLLGQVDLLFTSPPFPLNHKKRYGNLNGDEYVQWLADLAPRLTALLKPTGSLVMEVGNAWEPGLPAMSLLPLRALMAFVEAAKLTICQQFICHNPARLPTPAQWVTVERIRVKDSYTHVWWMAPSDRPKADNRRVLTEYSSSMKKLLDTQSYNAGKRPSGHSIRETTFLKNNGGAIPSNVLTFANTSQDTEYRKHCKDWDVPVHPARMPMGLPEFFIEMLTDPADIVLDPFAGSNTTGSVADTLGRRWIAVEPTNDYVDGSRGRFNGRFYKDQW